MCILVLCQEYFTKQTIEEQIKYPDNVVTAIIDLNVISVEFQQMHPAPMQAGSRRHVSQSSHLCSCVTMLP